MNDKSSRRFSVISGASSGIGRAIARMLVQEGRDLLLLGRAAERLGVLQEELLELEPGRAVECCEVDLTKDGAAQKVVAELEGASVELLVNSAGLVELGPLAEGSEESLERQLRLNVQAPVALTTALLPSLVDGLAQVIFINSTAGLRGKPGWGTYAASKFALRGVADSLREDLRPRGIRVVSVYPGRTDSPMQRSVYRMEGRPYEETKGVLQSPEDVASVLRAVVALPSHVEVSEFTIRPVHA